MDLNILVKTLFSVYRVLDKLSGSIDKMVRLKAFGSMATTMENLAVNDTLKISQDINNLTNKKINLINIKVITTDILKGIDKDFARLIILKYMENKKYAEISQILNISIRTAIRWHKSAISASVLQFKKANLLAGKMENFFIKENWLLSVYETFQKNENLEKKYNQKDIINKACKEYKSLLC